MIFVECKPDVALLKSLTNIRRQDIAHEFKGKPAICVRLRKVSNCKALVDEDPGDYQPPYLKETKVIKELPEHNLKVLHHKSGNNYLIVLCPKLEDWILQAAGEAGLDLRKYRLPNNAKKLHEVINIDLDKFGDLLEDLKSSARFKMLKGFIEKDIS